MNIQMLNNLKKNIDDLKGQYQSYPIFRRNLIAKHPDTLKFSNHTLKEMLKIMGYSRKRSTLVDKNKYRKSSNELKSTKINTFVYLYSNGYKFLFIDEVSCITNIYPNYGYSPKYQKFNVTKAKAPVNISMIVAMGVNKIFGFQIFLGSIKSTDFAAFIINIVD